MSVKTSEDAKREAQQKRAAEEKAALLKKEAEHKTKQESERRKEDEEKLRKEAIQQAKAAEKAAVKAAKNKKKSGWLPSRRTIIVSVLVAVAAFAYNYYLSMPDSRRLALAEQSFNTGNILFEGGDLSGAVQAYQHAVAVNPKHGDAWCNLGNVYSSLWQTRNTDQGLLKQAIFAYKKAISVNYKHVDAHFNLGVLYHTLESIDQAIAEYEIAVSIEPKHYDALSNLGSAKHKLQDLTGAIDAYQRAIEIVQGLDAEAVDSNQLSMLYYLLGTALSSLPDHRCQQASCFELAANKLRQSLQHNPENEEAKHALSALVSDPNVTAASAKYIRSLFDEYAANFDNALLRGLDYKAPELLHHAVESLANSSKIAQFETVYDAGCGTGLCGPLFRGMAKKLIGVDLSEPMVDKAQERGVYDELEAADITDSLAKYNNASDPSLYRKLDLIISADVFVYAGDLSAVFAAAAHALRKGGWFALTLERLEQDPAAADAAAAGSAAAAAAAEADGGANLTAASGRTVTNADMAKGWKLQLSGRFAHTHAYIKDLAAANGFQELNHEHIVPRRDNGVDIQGHLFILGLTR